MCDVNLYGNVFAGLFNASNIKSLRKNEHKSHKLPMNLGEKQSSSYIGNNRSGGLDIQYYEKLQLQRISNILPAM